MPMANTCLTAWHQESNKIIFNVGTAPNGQLYSLTDPNEGPDDTKDSDADPSNPGASMNDQPDPILIGEV